MSRRTEALFAVVFSLALASSGACNDEDSDDPSDSGADDAADDEADDDDDGGDDDDGDDGGPVDNVAACEDFIDAFECTEFDLSQSLMCNLYESTPCDVADYFDCLADEVTCTAIGFSDAAMACASLATCG